MLENSFGLTFFLKKSTKKNEKYVYLRINVDGIPKEVSTRYKWGPERWNQKIERAIGNKEDAKTLNFYIQTLQVKIQQFKNDLIWLVLGRNNGSHADRNYFRNQMQNNVIRETFFNEFKRLGKEYWTNIKDIPPIQNIETPEELHKYMQKETIDDYFIIGRSINFLDRRLSSENISQTILLEFQKLYPLYEIMRHK